MRNVLWSRASVCMCVCVCVCLSVRGRMPTLLHWSGCDFGEWWGMPPSCALLGGLAIGARVALLWQHKANAKCYMLVLALCLVCYTVLRSLKFSIIMCPICTHLHTHFTVLLLHQLFCCAWVCSLWPPIGHYILQLWFLSSFFFFPRLFSAVGDWMSTILPHMMWA